MTDKEPYIPIAERLNQDVWHDNFVPKYSALANATPSRVVLVGVWMIFAPTTIWAAGFAIYTLVSPEEPAVRVIQFLGSVGCTFLLTAIIIKQTRRYLNRNAVEAKNSA